MILDRLRPKARPARAVARALYEGAVRQARSTALYGPTGMADTPEGRFEGLTLHVLLLARRLRHAEGALSQIVFDNYISDLDGALREMGVGDLAVGKRMRRLGQAFYGRAKAFDDALSEGVGDEALRQVVGRTLLEGRPVGPGVLAEYCLRCRDALDAQLEENLAAGICVWPTL